MALLHQQLDNFSFDSDLLVKIKCLNIEGLKIASGYGRFDYVRALRNYHKLSWQTILLQWAFAYGFMFSKTGNLYSFFLPQTIEDDIINQMKKRFSQRVIDDCVVRLQIAYGKKLIPAHIDIGRTASLVYPVSNHAESRTVFFDIDRPINQQEKLFRLSELTKNTEIIIDRHPVLFDSNKIHAVCFSQAIPKKAARVSISIKWRNLPIEQVLSGMY